MTKCAWNAGATFTTNALSSAISSPPSALRGPTSMSPKVVKQNRFRIAGGRPYAAVSGMVTGVRQDTYANEHWIKVGEDKPCEEKAVEGLVARR